jgi:TonB family protein
MPKTFLRGLVLPLVLLTKPILPYAIGDDKHAVSPCEKPREVASPPQLSKEEREKARKTRAQGMVSISISEDGDVIDAKVVRSSSDEAADLLLAFAKSAKFKPRAGCGITHATINYTLAHQ